MGIWNSHTSVGNILGSLIAGVWVNHAWGWSFVVPGIIIGSLGVLVFFFLVPGTCLLVLLSHCITYQYRIDCESQMFLMIF